ncbi:MSMEG_0567/Sll0786 family nitrogen starvation N-acetyltransferase [Actinomycetospora aeridis]|uniref:MSMEG_0567/Sll0786 family nitrogen starvation N-acetyltransferase n=1 Tax=Actinomycetospora aeridis TaxID=3129231 RepID=A0ABU8MYQ3_9PSEU
MTRSVARPVVCAIATDEAERAAHHRVRRTVFVDEQGIFAGDDLDSHDARDDVLHVVARVGEEVVGTVRLFPLGDGVWQGDRLAVLAAARTAGAGGPLVRFAVATAAARGGRRMVAHVQPANRRFFERLGWTAGGTEEYAGRPHVFMTIELVRRARDDQTAVLDEPGTQLGG